MIGGHVLSSGNIRLSIADEEKIIKSHAKGHVPSKVTAQVGQDHDPGIGKQEEDRKADRTVQGEF